MREVRGAGGSPLHEGEGVGRVNAEGLAQAEGLEEDDDEYKNTGVKGKKAKDKGKQKQKKDVKHMKMKPVRRDEDPDSPSGGAVQQPLGRDLSSKFV